MGVFCARSEDATLDPVRPSVAATRSFVRHVRFTAAVVFAVAVLILLGWALDLTLLKSGMSGQRATQPLTAVCFALSAVALGLSTERWVLCRALSRVGALVVLCVVIATVWQNALDVDWGLDQFLFSDAVVHEQPGQYLRPGRPAAGTLVVLGLLAVCLLLARAKSAAARASYVWLSTAAALVGTSVLLAYAYSLNAVYAVGFYAHVGLISGIEIALLAGGVLLRRPDLGWMRLLAGDTSGGRSARGMLLWTGSLLLILATIVRMGQSAALYGGGFLVTLLTVGGAGVLLVALLSHARRINLLESSRHSVATDLRAAESLLLRAAHEREKQFATIAHELRNPLTPLRNGIEIVRQTSGTDPVLARTVDMMSRQIGHLLRLAENLVATDDPQALAESRETAPPAAESARMKILIADDNADGADSLAMLLQTQGYMVLTAPDGRRAVELSEAFRPDVILMDVAMPHMDGLQATREIRLHLWGSRIRVIALTAWGGEAERRRTLEAGMDFHLVKPVDPQVLAALLRELPSPGKGLPPEGG
jgi:CheY-like chemotaxis protein